MGSEAVVVTSKVYCVVLLVAATKGFILLPVLLTGLVRPMHTDILLLKLHHLSVNQLCGIPHKCRFGSLLVTWVLFGLLNLPKKCLNSVSP